MESCFEITPLLIRRERGGWLALSPEGEPLKLGATGQSEADATAAFRHIFAACKNDLKSARAC
jgi:hypothetical protein